MSKYVVTYADGATIYDGDSIDSAIAAWSDCRYDTDIYVDGERVWRTKQHPRGTTPTPFVERVKEQMLEDDEAYYRLRPDLRPDRR